MNYRDEFLTSAFMFVREGLSCAEAALATQREEKWRFAVFHLVTAFEHFAKHNLSLIHPVLVRDQILKTDRTVSIEEAIRRLRDAEIKGETYSPSDDRMLRTIVKMRNEIVHGKVQLETPFNYYKFFELFSYLRYYCLKNINESLDDLVDPREMPNFVRSEHLVKENVKRAKTETKNEVKLWACFACGQRFLHLRGNGYTCALCHEEEDEENCPRCSVVSPSSGIEPIYEHYVHWDYWEFFDFLENGGIAESSCESCRKDHAREVEDALEQFQHEQWQDSYFDEYVLEQTKPQT